MKSLQVSTLCLLLGAMSCLGGQLPSQQQDSSLEIGLENTEALHHEDKLLAKASFDLLSDHYPLPYLGSQHQVRQLALDGRIVGLDDGSRWEIERWDRHTVLSWLSTDRIVFTTHNKQHPYYNYQLCNLSTGQQVVAALHDASLEPGSDLPTARWIIACNGHQFLLNDSFLLQVSMWDSAYADRFEVGDVLLFGVNTDWLSYVGNPYLVVNVNMDVCVRASVE